MNGLIMLYEALIDIHIPDDKARAVCMAMAEAMAGRWNSGIGQYELPGEPVSRRSPPPSPPGETLPTS